MENREQEELAQLTLAPWIQKATALRGDPRKVGGNQFRHAMATLAILLDYHYTDGVLLKSAIIHDLLEDRPETTWEEIAGVDKDGPAVWALVFEVSRHQDETKPQYLKRLRDHGSRMARILKVADRISNLTDLHADIFSAKHMQGYLAQTRTYVQPIAHAVDARMALEVDDLIERRSRTLRELKEHG